MNAYEKVMNELGKIKSMFENATEETVEKIGRAHV